MTLPSLEIYIDPYIAREAHASLQDTVCSENIYNMDEKGFLLGQALKVKVICRRGRKNPRLM
jgi:hypothetical protein